MEFIYSRRRCVVRGYGRVATVAAHAASSSFVCFHFLSLFAINNEIGDKTTRQVVITRTK